MVRWEPGTRERLYAAALELFATRGYEQTTAAEIAQSIGLSERTFFRHFADKREVVFAGSEIPETAARLITAASADLEPMQVVRQVLHQVAAARFDGHHQQMAVWRRVIEGADELRDRDARKRSDLVRAARAAFVERGQTPMQATVVAEVGVLVFQVALETWAAEPDPGPMADTIDTVFAALPTAPTTA